MKYQKGEIVKGKVKKIENYGIFVELSEPFTGLIHISEITNGFVSNINSYVNENDIIYVKLLSDPDEQNRIDLSIKNIDYRFNDEYIINSNNKNKYSFDTMEKKLPIWIDKKLNEEEMI